MPNASASRTIAAPVLQLWEVIRDPHHLPRWWPRVTRVEDVQDGAFTEVMRTRKGKLVRADFNVVARDDGERSLTWVQQIDGTPFARVLKSAETQVRLAPVGTSAPASGHGGAGAATTHYEGLKALALADPRFVNASVGFDLASMTPTFQLAMGVPGSSSALAVARRFGMPSTVIERAERFLTREDHNFEDVVKRLNHERAALELARTKPPT